MLPLITAFKEFFYLEKVPLKELFGSRNLYISILTVLGYVICVRLLLHSLHVLKQYYRLFWVQGAYCCIYT